MNKNISIHCFIVSCFLPFVSANAYETTSAGSVYEINPAETPNPLTIQLDNLLDSPKLDGDYIHIFNSSNCSTCNYSLSDRTLSDDFVYPASSIEFSEVMAYYHLNNYHKYVTGTLGFTLTASALPVDVYDTTAVGAHYLPNVFGAARNIYLGTSNLIDTDGDWINDLNIDVDMSRSADVLIHEYTHSIIDELSPIYFYSVPWFLQEGWGDYLAGSYLNVTRIGSWTDRQSYRGYRRSMVEGISENDLWPLENIRSADGVTLNTYLNARNYYNSMRWSGFLWRLRERISSIVVGNGTNAAQITDSLVIKSIELFIDTNGTVDDPVSEMNGGLTAIKLALGHFKSLPNTDPQFNGSYSLIVDSDVDAAFDSRYRETIAGSTMNWNQTSLIQKEKAWSHQTGSKDVAVAIIDSGIYPNFHTEILYSEDINFNGILDVNEDVNGNNILDTGNLYINKQEIPGDQIDNDNNGFIDDVSGWDFSGNDPDPSDQLFFTGLSHGTEVARNFSEVIWDASILNLRNRKLFFNYMSANHHQTEAVDYAIANKINLINISAGYYEDGGGLNDLSQTFQMAAFNQIQKGLVDEGNETLIIAAAGNDAWDIDQKPVYSASFPLPNVVSVTQTDLNDLLSLSVNFGKYNVDLSATVPGARATSYAAPKVTAALTLLLSEQKNRQEAHPNYRSLTMGEIKYLLLTSVDHLPSLEGITVSEGRLNVNNLLTSYENDADWDGYSAIIENLFNTDPNDSASYPDLLNGDADGDGLSNHLELSYGTIPININANTNYTGKLYPVYLNNDGSILNGLSASDSDQDGINDLDETQIINGYYTDPANPDTDADGVMDGVDESPSYAKVTLNNLSLSATASASDTFAFFNALRAIDGNEATFWSTGASTAPPHWLAIDLNKESKIYSIKTIFDAALRIPTDYVLQFSQDGDFNNGVIYQFSVSNNTNSNRLDVLPFPVDANFVRILITDPSVDGLGNNFVRIRELEIQGTQSANLALGKTFNQSDYFFIWDGARAIDENINTFWAISPSTGSSHWLSVDLQGSAVINEVEVHFDNTTVVASKFKLQFSNTGDFSATASKAPFEMIIDNSGLSENKIVKIKTPISAKHIRLVLEEPSGASDFIRVREFKVNGTIH